MRRKSLKNSKHLVDLIESATLPALNLLVTAEQFAFLRTALATAPAGEEKVMLCDALSSARKEDIAIADQEAVRLLQISGFRAEEILAHAYAKLEFDAHPELDSYEPAADVMSRMIWLRAKAPNIFDQIETIYLTHHFHGHKKFLGFSVRGGEGQDFVWTEEVEKKLHAAVGEILALDDEARAGCEVTHFEMEEGEEADRRRLHYLVVYHPGKMRVLRRMQDRRRDLLPFIPALEATLVYDPADNKVHVLSARPSVAKQLADRFAKIGFEKPLSREPVDAVSYELSLFRAPVDLTAAKATGVTIEAGWISSLTMNLGHTRHSLTLKLDSNENVWNIAETHFGTYDPISRSRAIQEVELSFVVQFDGEVTPRALDITVGQGGACSLLTLPDPRLRRCGEEILISLGVMRRVTPAPVGTSLTMFKAELALLDLGNEDVDGFLLRALGLSGDLVHEGLLKEKKWVRGEFITVPIEGEEGERGFRRLPVQLNSTRAWAEDDISGNSIDLRESDLCRYTVDKAYLRERLGLLLKDQLLDQPLSPDQSEPYLLGSYVMGNQRLPVFLASRLWDAKYAAAVDTELRKLSVGLCLVLTTTAKPQHRFLGSGIVVSITDLINDGDNDVAIDLARIEGEVRRWRNAAEIADTPTLIREDMHSAMLVGPWPQPWALTRREWIDVVEILVQAWTSGKKKCTKRQLEAAARITIRSLGEFFRQAPEWLGYIRGADRPIKARLWELNIGQPEYMAAETPVPDGDENTADEVEETEES